jgi:hypothetical protein
VAAGWGKLKEESRKSLEMFRPRPGSASFHFPNVPNGQQSDAVTVDVTGWDFMQQVRPWHCMDIGRFYNPCFRFLFVACAACAAALAWSGRVS